MKFRIFPVIPVLLLVAGCAMTPRHEFDPATDFSSYESYSWKAPEYGEGEVSDPILDSPLLGKRVASAVNTALQARGFERDDDSPDMILTYHTAKDIEFRNNGPRFSIGVHHGWPHLHTGLIFGSRTTASKQGVLIIDVIDAETEALVWRGWRDLPLVQEYFKSDRVNRTVRDILSAFPPERDARQ